MPLYTFYPCKPDGSSDSFVTFDLIGDDEAFIRGLHVLDQHGSATHVVGWCGERKVLTRWRVHRDLTATLYQGDRS